MHRLFLALAGFWGMTGIILGSLSSHALKAVLSAQALGMFTLGVQYQMYHALALLAIALLLKTQTNRIVVIAGVLFNIGILFFSGTMYAITYFAWSTSGTAPIGGFAFILGWLLLIVAGLRRR